MASRIMSNEERKELEEMAASTQPYDDDDLKLLIFDGPMGTMEDEKRFLATIAKKCLEGKL